MENQRKQQETKKKLADAFMELYAVKEIDRIPIKTITDRAGLHRATFYVYFNDVYDLRERIEDYFLEKVCAILGNLDLMDIENLFQKILALYQDTGPYLPILLGKEGSPFPRRAKVAMIERIRAANPGLPLTVRLEYAVEYHVAGLMGVFGRLPGADSPFGPAEAAALIRDVAAKGVAAVIQAERKE